MIDHPSARTRLAAELAVGLARRLWMALGHGATDAGFCWTHFQTTFIEGCYALWELDVALAGTEFGGEDGPLGSDQGMTWQQYAAHARQDPREERFAQQWFKFLPAPETRAGVLAHGELPGALFERLLAAYVDNACVYGPDGTQLCSDREPFKPTVEFEREIGALVECGYAERCGDMVKWTDKIAAVMQVADFWEAPAVVMPDEAQAQVEDLVRSGQRLAAVATIQHIANVGITQAQAHADELERALQRTDKIAPVMRTEHCWDDSRPEIKTLSHDVQERVHILVQDRNPIAAIALVRAETSAGIVECKAYVDDLTRKSHRMPPHRPRR
jgi:ribosomal protein L7/L12